MQIESNHPPAGLAPSTVLRDVERLRDVTGQLAGTVFYGTLLRTMRDSVLKGPYGHGGRGEEIFAEQLHGRLAERLGRATKNNLGDQLFRHLECQQRAISRARSSTESQP